MNRQELFILSPTETLPTGRLETMLGFTIEFQPRENPYGRLDGEVGEGTPDLRVI